MPELIVADSETTLKVRAATTSSLSSEGVTEPVANVLTAVPVAPVS